jgi:endonuclease/exonuclease/phosphatase family metal-dependent hydrolase
MKNDCIRATLLIIVALLGACRGEPGSLPGTQSLTILTFNVLGSADREDLRIPALLRIIEESEADILCLQEVRASFLRELQAQPWFGDRYQAPKIDGLDAIANGNYICSRFEVESVEVIDHNSPRAGRASCCGCASQDVPWRLRPATWRSLLEDGPVRARQLDDVFPSLDGAECAIFAGDFNFGDGELPDTAHLDPRYLDLWSVLHPRDPGFTWDIEASDLARRGSFPGEPSRRLDRILLRSVFFRPTSIRIVGNEPLADRDLFPSDHFGLIGVISTGR